MVKTVLMKIIIPFISLLLCGGVSAQVLVNEIMANEPGGNVMLEWIELYNNSDEDIFLGLYSLDIDGDIMLLPDLYLYPYEYIIFCRKLFSDVQSAGFEEVWGDNSGIWGDNADSEDYLIHELAGIGLTNSGGTVTLLRAAQSVSSLSWSDEGADGVSWERLLPDNNIPGQSTDRAGSTPGRVNSITPLAFDLALLPVETRFLGDGVSEFIIAMTNIGLNDMPAGEISIYYDPDRDSVTVETDLIAVIEYPETSPGDTIEYYAYFELDGVQPNVLLTLPPDYRPGNNVQIVTTFGIDYPPVIISEFLADPKDDLDAEWVELKNRGDETIDLSDWHLGDEVKFYPIVPSDTLIFPDVIIEPGDYLVLCKDVVAFEDYYGVGINVIEMNSWPTLNNDGDIIRLRDDLDNIVDSIQYDFTYGGNYTWGRGEEPDMTDRWGRSIEIGGTPGEANAVYFEAVSSSISVTAEPNPFSPSKDGQMEISFEVPPGENLTVKIYDIKGRVVKTLIDNLTAFEGSVMWDGRSDGGRKLKIGMYVLYIEVDDVEDYKQTIVIAP